MERKSYIYKLWNENAPNHFYIGTTVNIKKRLSQHRTEIRLKRYKHIFLYSFLKNLPTNTLRIEVLETVDYKDRFTAEARLIRVLRPDLNTQRPGIGQIYPDRPNIPDKPTEPYKPTEPEPVEILPEYGPHTIIMTQLVAILDSCLENTNFRESPNVQLVN